MLHFTEEQTRLILRKRRDAFVRQLTRRARDRHGAAIDHLDDEALWAFLLREIEDARGIGLRTRSELERFTDLALVFGAGFATRLDWARTAFADCRLKPGRRLDKVEETAVFVSRAG